MHHRLAYWLVCLMTSGCLLSSDQLEDWHAEGSRSGRSSSDTAGGGGSGGSSNSVGDATGVFEVTIEDLCSIGWDLSGSYLGDFAWDAELTINDGLTSCDGSDASSGRLVIAGGSAYFNSSYIGTVIYSSDTSLSWSTDGYVSGGGGGSYAYDGNIEW